MSNIQVLGEDPKNPGRLRVRGFDGKIYNNVPSDITPSQFEYGLKRQNAPGFTGSVSGAFNYLLPQWYNSAMASVYEGTPDQQTYEQAAKGYADQYNKEVGQYQRSVSDIDSVFDLNDIAVVGLEQAGSMLPQVGASLAAGALGSTVGAPVLAGSVMAAPFFYAQNIDRQRQEQEALGTPNINYDQTRAALAAAAQTGLEAVSGGMLVYGGKMLNHATNTLGLKPGNVSKFLGTMGAVASTNAGTEVMQQMAERWQADLPLLSEEAQKEYYEAAIAAIVVGVPLGAAGHAFTPRQVDEKKSEVPQEKAQETPAEEPKGPSTAEQLEKDITSKRPVERVEQSGTEPVNPIETLFNIENEQSILSRQEAAKYFKDNYPNSISDAVIAKMSDEDLIGAANRNIAIKKQQAQYSGGVSGLNFDGRGVIWKVPRKLSDEPHVQTMESWLYDKFGYDPDFLQGLSDNSLKQLFNVKVRKYIDSMQQPLIEQEKRPLLTDQRSPQDKMTATEPSMADESMLQPVKQFTDEIAAEQEFYKQKAQQDAINDIKSRNQPRSDMEQEAYRQIIEKSKPTNRFKLPQRPAEPITPEKLIQLLNPDPAVADAAADAQYVRNVKEKIAKEKPAKQQEKLNRIREANKKMSSEVLSADAKAKEFLKDPLKLGISDRAKYEPDPNRQEFRAKTKKDFQAQVEGKTDTVVVEEPKTDIKLSEDLVNKKPVLLNKYLAFVLRNKGIPDEVNQIIKDFFDGDLTATSTIFAALSPDQSRLADTHALLQFLKGKEADYRKLLPRFKTMLSAKHSILPKDLDILGEGLIMKAALDEFTKGRDKAFGNDLFKEFLARKNALKKFFNEQGYKSFDGLINDDPSRVNVQANAQVVANPGQPTGNAGGTGGGGINPPNPPPVMPPGLQPKDPTFLSWVLSPFSTIPGIARVDPYVAKILNNRRASLEFQREIEAALSKVYENLLKSPTFNDNANLIAYLRKSGQKLIVNNNGQLTYTNKQGNPVTLSQAATSDLMAHQHAIKEGGRLYLKALKERLNGFSNLGLSSNSTYADIQAAVRNLEAMLQTAQNMPRDLVDAYSDQLDFLNKSAANFKHIEESVNDVASPYIPYMRFGSHAVAVKDRATGKLVGMYMMEDERALTYKNPSASQLRSMVSKLNIDPRFNNRAQYEITPPFRLTYADVTKHIRGSAQITQELIASLMNSPNHSLANLATNLQAGQQGASWNQIRQERSKILKLVSDKALAKFWLNSDNVDGWSEDWPRVMSAHTNAVARSIGQLKTSESFARNFAELQKADIPDWQKNRANNIIDYYQDNGTDAANIRAFGFLWALGFNLSSALLQFGTIAAHGPSALSLLGVDPVGDHIRVSSAMRVGVRPSSFAEPEFKQLLKDHPEYFTVNQSNEAFENFTYDKGSLKGSLLRRQEQLNNYAGYMLGQAESISRRSIAYAAWKKIKDNPGAAAIYEDSNKNNPDWLAFRQERSDIPLEDAIVLHLMRDIHGTFGKLGRGVMQRGSVGAVAFPFSTYVAQTLERMYHSATKKGWRGKVEVGLTMAWYLGLAGLMGIPGYELLEEGGDLLWSNLTGVKHSVRKEISEEIAKSMNVDPTTLIKGGATSVSGADLGNRLGLQPVTTRLVTDLIRIASGEKVDVTSYNPLISLAASPFRVAQSMGSGKDLGASLNPILPVAFSNLLKAADMLSGNNPETRRGNPLPLREPLTTSEKISQGLGFTPFKITQAREDLFYGKSWKQGQFSAIKTKYADIVARLRFRARSAKGEEAAAINKKIKETYNEMLLTLKNDPQFKITPDFWSGFERSVQNRVKERINPEVNLTPEQIRERRGQ